eukprot:1055397-Amorphochlora_amoeboformis.AAC.1
MLASKSMVDPANMIPTLPASTISPDINIPNNSVGRPSMGGANVPNMSNMPDPYTISLEAYAYPISSHP